MAGTLIIGGHEDREGEKAILKEVAGRARGRRVVVVATASQDPEEVFATYRKAFNALGVKEVVPLQAATREEALDAKAGELVKGAGAVFSTGGDQLRLTSQLGDTPVFQNVQAVYEGGGVVAGMSAGASVLSDTMLVSGESDSSPRSGTPSRWPRGSGSSKTWSSTSTSPSAGGWGACWPPSPRTRSPSAWALTRRRPSSSSGPRFRVIGNGAVYVVDASGVTFSTVADAEGNQPLSLHDAKVHVLAPGDKFDLKVGRPIQPSEK